MKLTTISATYDRKMNLGDYNSAHIAMTLWADLEDGDDPAIAAEALRTMARHQVMAEMVRIKPELQAKVESIFMGLPVSVREQVSPVDKNGVPYVQKNNGRHYVGKNAQTAIENDLKELDRKHGGY